VGKGDKPATMPLTVPVLRVLEVCRGERATGPLILRPISLAGPSTAAMPTEWSRGSPRPAAIPRHISPHSLRHAAITNALDGGVPRRDAQILARHADPRTTERYDLFDAGLSVGSAHASAKTAGVVGGMLADAESIDNLDLLRHGAMARMFAGVRARSTLGTFLRSFTHEHVQQLDAVGGRLLAGLSRQALGLLAGAGSNDGSRSSMSTTPSARSPG